MPNLAMAFVAVLLTMLLFQPPMVAFVAAGCIASTVMCMVTVMLVWDVKVTRWRGGLNRERRPALTSPH